MREVIGIKKIKGVFVELDQAHITSFITTSAILVPYDGSTSSQSIKEVDNL